MKLISSSSPSNRKTFPGLTQGWLRRNLRSRALKRLFSKQTAWWVLVIIVAFFACTLVYLFRQLVETVQAQ